MHLNTQSTTTFSHRASRAVSVHGGWWFKYEPLNIWCRDGLRRCLKAFMYLFCVRRNKKAQKKGYDDPTSILARLCIQLKYQVKVRWFQEKRGGVDWTDPPTETAAWTGTQEGHREARAILVLNGRWVHHLGISQGCWTVSSTRWIQKTGSGPIMEIKAALPNTNLFFFLFFLVQSHDWGSALRVTWWSTFPPT